jgi:hypothetical protein
VDAAERRGEYGVRADRRTGASGGRVAAGDRHEEAPGEAEGEEERDDPATANPGLAALRGEAGLPAALEELWAALDGAHFPGQRRLPSVVEVDHEFGRFRWSSSSRGKIEVRPRAVVRAGSR